MFSEKTAFEHTYLVLEPFFQPLLRQSRSSIRALANELRSGRTPRILDVGGRKSHYTIGVDADFVISDIPRSSQVQNRLNLGFNGDVIQSLRARRSNVSHVVYDDMTSSSFRSESFDCVIAIEVLEHVDRDADFVREVARVLRPGGAFYMTTPNGDFVANTNPDHRRHYRRRQLEELLKPRFSDLEVAYTVRSGIFHRWGLKSWSLQRPFVTLRGMTSNVINGWESAPYRLAEQAERTQHLVAVARKAEP